MEVQILLPTLSLRNSSMVEHTHDKGGDGSLNLLFAISLHYGQIGKATVFGTGDYRFESC